MLLLKCICYYVQNSHLSDGDDERQVFNSDSKSADSVCNVNKHHHTSLTLSSQYVSSPLYFP